MKEVLSLATETEVGALFHNSKETCPLGTALTKMGHLQKTTTITTDNSTACWISNTNVKQCQSKAINMCFYWVRDGVSQGHFTVIWKKGN
jgi:hypothetical protein